MKGAFGKGPKGGVVKKKKTRRERITQYLKHQEDQDITLLTLLH